MMDLLWLCALSSPGALQSCPGFHWRRLGKSGDNPRWHWKGNKANWIHAQSTATKWFFFKGEKHNETDLLISWQDTSTLLRATHNLWCWAKDLILSSAFKMLFLALITSSIMMALKWDTVTKVQEVLMSISDNKSRIDSLSAGVHIWKVKQQCRLTHFNENACVPRVWVSGLESEMYMKMVLFIPYAK